MKSPNKNILTIVLIILIISIFTVTNNSNHLQGTLHKASKYSKKTKQKIYSVEKSDLVQTLKPGNYKYVDLQTNFRPGSTLKKSQKERLLKIFPFATLKDYTKIKINTKVEPIDITNLDFSSYDLKYKWQHIGIRGSGVVTSIDYERNNPDHLLMSTEAAGIFRSLDFGKTWKFLSRFPLNWVDSVAIDPNNNKHYIALANNTYIYESFDSGTNWELIHSIDQSFFSSSKNLVWQGQNIIVNSSNKVSVSNNNGRTWNNYEFGDNFGSYSKQIEIKPSGLGLYSNLDNQLFLTRNYGQDWQQLEHNFPNTINSYDITNDGGLIILAGNNFDGHLFLSKSYDLGETWENSTNEEVYLGKIQDIIIDAENLDIISLFSYLRGLHRSLDGGQNFEKHEITLEDDLVYLQNALDPESENYTEYSIIEPLDLRFDNMKSINKQDGSRIYLMPTDQGIFSYDSNQDQLNNIAKDIYIGDTGKLRVSSCPRVYTGLWHIGLTVIDQNNLVSGINIGEKFGAEIGRDENCVTEVLFTNGIYGTNNEYSNNGQFFPSNNELETTSWLFSNMPILARQTTYKYHDRWWYLFGKVNENNQRREVLGRVNLDERIYEEITIPRSGDNIVISGFNITEENGETNYWLVDIYTYENNIKLWNSTNLQDWTEIKDFDNEITHILNQDNLPIGGALTHGETMGLFKKGNTFILSDLGVLTSNDNGATWTINFEYSDASNVVEDSSGRLYLGLSPNMTETSLTEDVTGVWYSDDNGENWELLEPTLRKSWITGLDIDKERGFLYASTKGESVLKFDLNLYFNQ